jgi:hypothetical protein
MASAAAFATIALTLQHATDASLASVEFQFNRAAPIGPIAYDTVV